TSCSTRPCAGVWPDAAVTGSDMSREAIVEHLEGHDHDYDREDESQAWRLEVGEHPRTSESATEYAEHDGEGESGIDVPAVQVYAGAGRRRHADHEIAGGGGHLEREAHRAVHRDHL